MHAHSFRCPPQAKNTITFGQYNPQKLTKKKKEKKRESFDYMELTIRSCHICHNQFMELYFAARIYAALCIHLPFSLFLILCAMILLCTKLL